MEFEWPDHVAQLAADARTFGAKWAKPLGEYAGISSSREFSLEMGRRGWLGIDWPKNFGGGGKTALERFAITESLVSVGAPMGRTWISERQIGPVLMEFGTDEQRARYLPGILDGSECWCLGLSESDAGSDVSAIRTTASLDGDAYIVNGSKMWTSFAEEADYIYLIARTEKGSPPHSAMSELIVNMDSPGVSVQPIRDMTGGRRFNQIMFDDVVVPVTARVGEAGGAFRQVMRQLEHERGGIDRLVSNRALFVAACEACTWSDPVLRQEAAELEARYRIGRLLVLRSALGQSPKGYSAVTKIFCTELQQKVASFAEKVFGPTSVLSGPVARAICYAPAYTIQGGTSEVLRNVVAQRYLGLPRA